MGLNYHDAIALVGNGEMMARAAWDNKRSIQLGTLGNVGKDLIVQVDGSGEETSFTPTEEDEKATDWDYVRSLRAAEGQAPEAAPEPKDEGEK